MLFFSPHCTEFLLRKARFPWLNMTRAEKDCRRMQLTQPLKLILLPSCFHQSSDPPQFCWKKGDIAGTELMKVKS